MAGSVAPFTRDVLEPFRQYVDNKKGIEIWRYIKEDIPFLKVTQINSDEVNLVTLENQFVSRKPDSLGQRLANASYQETKAFFDISHKLALELASKCKCKSSRTMIFDLKAQDAHLKHSSAYFIQQHAFRELSRKENDDKYVISEYIRRQTVVELQPVV